MTRSRIMTVAAALAVGLTLPAVSLAGTASAALIDKGPIIGDSWGPEVIEDFCGVAGLTVSLVGTGEGKFWVKSTGTDGYPLWTSHGTDTEVLTNVATGRQATYVNERRSHETKVTYHDDGTYTLHVSGTEHGVWYDDTGASDRNGCRTVRLRAVVRRHGDADRLLRRRETRPGGRRPRDRPSGHPHRAGVLRCHRSGPPVAPARYRPCLLQGRPQPRCARQPRKISE